MLQKLDEEMPRNFSTTEELRDIMRYYSKRGQAEMQENFYRAVYAAVRRIPAGKVATYGQIAMLAGSPRASRIVGGALHRNPEPGKTPCHRVVFRDGSLAPGFAFGGPGAQRALLIFDIDYDAYNQSARYITYLLTPATACLALPLYRQIQKLREYPLAIVAGILTGVAVNALCVLAVALVFRLGHYDFVTLIPKSVTGAVGMPLAEELGGTGGITMAAISITGIFGNILGPQVLRWFHVTDPVAQGVAMGCGSHAFGTVRALEMGEVEGAMGSLSLVITALLTVVIAPFLGNLI